MGCKNDKKVLYIRLATNYNNGEVSGSGNLF